MNPQTAELPLRDIHAAGAPPWWPPAAGWWVLAAIAAALALWLGWRLWRVWRRRRRRLALRAELAGILAHWRARRDDRQFLGAASAFFRRLVVHVGGRREMAGVTGAAWAQFLAEAARDDQERDLSSLLAEGPYRPAPAIVDAERIMPLAERWIRRVTEDRRA